MNRKVFLFVRLALYAGAAAAFLLIPSSFFEAHPLCLVRLVTGHGCLSCGTTRAFSNAMHLRYLRAVSFNPLVLILYPLFWYLFADDLYSALRLARKVVRFSFFEKIWLRLFPKSLR